MKIGFALKRLRKELGLTQKEMIQGTNLKLSHYSKLELDQNRIYVKDLLKILKINNVSPEYFFRKFYKVDDAINKQNTEINKLSLALNIAFYENDIRKANLIAEKIQKNKLASKEMKDRAILTINAMKNVENDNDKELRQEILNYFFEYENWSHDKAALRLLGNSIRTDNVVELKPTIYFLTRKYKNNVYLPREEQVRVSTIFINYLFNAYKRGVLISNDIVFKWFDELPSVPELGLVKQLAVYFKKLVNKEYLEAEQIKNVLILTGYGSIVKKI